jgi:hypothetical protein
MNNPNQQIIPYYSPISAKGGRRSRRNLLSRRHKKTRHNRRTKRRY